MATSAPYGAIKSVERAPLNPNGTLGAWANMSDLPFASENMTYAEANGRIHLLGGSSSGGITSTVVFADVEGGVARVYLPVVLRSYAGSW